MLTALALLSLGADPVVGSGGLSKLEIQKVIQKNQHQMKRCFDELLAVNPDATGSVTTTLTIGPEGLIDSVEIMKSDMPESMGTCMRGAIAKWKFPEPKGGGKVTVNYPWVFKAK